MCQRSIYPRSCSRIAEEVQLKAEEEFMLEALKMIKQQRNCLQIERLHLESLKQKLQNPGARKDDQEESAGADKESTNPSQSKPTELMSAVDLMSMGSKQHQNDFAEMDDVQCNNEELHLNLSAGASGLNTTMPPYNQYEYPSDEESSSDVSDGDDVMIDINMLMNGGSTGYK